VKPRSVIFVVLGVLFVPFVYGSSSIPDACAEIRDPNFDSGKCTGSKYDKGGQTCCWREKVPGKILADTYCQTCTATCDSKGDCNEKCTEKTKQALKLPTDQSGPLGSVLEEQTTTTPPILEAQRANITILPGGILQEGNTSSNDSSSGFLGMEQSDLVSNESKNKTSTVNDEEQQESETTDEEDNESGPSRGQAREGTDDADNQENVDEELPLE
jgi:hypothetical protein